MTNTELVITVTCFFFCMLAGRAAYMSLCVLEPRWNEFAGYAISQAIVIGGLLWILCWKNDRATRRTENLWATNNVARYNTIWRTSDPDPQAIDWHQDRARLTIGAITGDMREPLAADIVLGFRADGTVVWKERQANSK
jgi:hypothetical protein